MTLVDQAAEALQQYLSQHQGSAEKKQILADLDHGQRAIERAATKLGVISTRGPGFQKGALWTLPTHSN